MWNRQISRDNKAILCYRPEAVGDSHRVISAAFVVALSATVLASSPVHADGARNAGSTARGEQAALLAVYAAESALARAEKDALRQRRQAERLRTREATLTRHLSIVRASHAETQRRVATLLRTLYENGGNDDPLAVFLGARSLDEALEGVDSLARAASLHRRLGVKAAEGARRLASAAGRAAAARRQSTEAVAQADAAADVARAAVVGHREELDRIRRSHRLADARVAVLEIEAKKAEAKSTTINEVESSDEAVADAGEQQATPAATAPVTPPRGGTRTLTVDAVAYHLPGFTASGLPVGPGVIAVDPSVIPLGTRVFVPGYGPAVAADTGSAIKGLIIDLWMSSTEKARAWGRRTVTITIYG